MEHYDDLKSSDDTTLVGGETIADWVLNKAQLWRDHFDSKYKPRFDEYYRIWRGEWAMEDISRQSERSRLVSPGSMQAVEECAAEVEEATFTGNLFDIRDDEDDSNKLDIAKLRRKLKEDFAFCRVETGISESILNGAVYGTGCAEIVMDEIVEQKVAQQPALGGGAVQVGVSTRLRTVVKLRPLLPQNLLVDPNGTSIENALGVIIDEFVDKEQVTIQQEKGVYDKEVDVGAATAESALEPTQDFLVYDEDRVRLTRYFGLVPRTLLDAHTAAQAADGDDEPSEIVDLSVEGEDEESYYVEAIVVLGNGKLLKASKNPYMMQDRPLVAFPWDIVPGQFYGRGVIEKAYNSQKAVDVEIRARIDALALTNHPMMGIDATRMPRGAKTTIRPGKMIMTNGNPSEILHPFNFGQVSQITFAQAESLQKMLQQATGAVNAAGMPNDAAQGGAKTGAIAMALGSVMKRHKRTLLAFQSNFLLPLVQKAAWRYMQFDPEAYPVGDYKFHCEGSLGLIGREYETAQLAQLLQSMPPDSPLYTTLLRSIVDGMALSNREEMLAQLDEAAKPNEEKIAQEKQAHEAELAIKEATLMVLKGQGSEAMAHGALYKAQLDNIPMENQIAMARVAAQNREPGDGKDDEFAKRLRILDEIRKDRELNIREAEGAARIEDARMERQMKQKAAEQENQAIKDALTDG